MKSERPFDERETIGTGCKSRIIDETSNRALHLSYQIFERPLPKHVHTTYVLLKIGIFTDDEYHIIRPAHNDTMVRSERMAETAAERCIGILVLSGALVQ